MDTSSSQGVGHPFGEPSHLGPRFRIILAGLSLAVPSDILMSKAVGRASRGVPPGGGSRMRKYRGSSTLSGCRLRLPRIFFLTGTLASAPVTCCPGASAPKFAALAYRVLSKSLRLVFDSETTPPSFAAAGFEHPLWCGDRRN